MPIQFLAAGAATAGTLALSRLAISMIGRRAVGASVARRGAFVRQDQLRQLLPGNRGGGTRTLRRGYGLQVDARYRRMSRRRMEQMLERVYADGVIEMLRTPPHWPRGPESNRIKYPIPSGFRFRYDYRRKEFYNPAPYWPKVERQGRYVERAIHKYGNTHRGNERMAKALRDAGFF